VFLKKEWQESLEVKKIYIQFIGPADSVDLFNGRKGVGCCQLCRECEARARRHAWLFYWDLCLSFSSEKDFFRDVALLRW
jgi:hypothetical protein